MIFKQHEKSSKYSMELNKGGGTNSDPEVFKLKELEEETPFQPEKVHTMRKDIARLQTKGVDNIERDFQEPKPEKEKEITESPVTDIPSESKDDVVQEVSQNTDTGKDPSFAEQAPLSAQEITQALRRVAEEWEPLENEKERLQSLLDALQAQELSPILAREKETEEKKQKLEKEQAVSGEESRELMEQRWKAEDERRAVEQERWGVEDKMHNIQQDLANIQGRIAEIATQEQALLKQGERLKAKKELEALRERLVEEEQSLKEIQVERQSQKEKTDTIRQQQEEVGHELALLQEKNFSLKETLLKIEKEEQEAKDPDVRKTIEQQRWDKEIERRSVEQEAWEKQNQKRHIDKETEMLVSKLRIAEQQETDAKKRIGALSAKKEEQEALLPSKKLEE
ncbi:MAG: hypothetical protein Q8P71_01425 [bacterium]|nr:hypothetical protein [bacterium]